MSPSTQHLVFVSGYSPEDQPGIQAFTFDEENGAFNKIGEFSGILNPSYIKVHPNGRWIYSVSESSKSQDGVAGSVCSLSFEAKPFSMQLLNRQMSGGDWPCHLELDSTGNWLFVANYGSGTAAVFPIREDGSLGEVADFLEHSGRGRHIHRQEGPHVHSVTVTPDIKFALVADLGIDQIVAYRFDHNTGKLGKHNVTHSKPSAGPRHIAFHPNHEWLYLANELDNTVNFYSYNKDHGALMEHQTISCLPNDAPENTAADIHLSPSGQKLFVSNRGHNSLAAYEVGPQGFLKLISITSCGGIWPRNFAITPSGKYILVANERSNEVCVLPLIEGPVALGAPVGRVPVSKASCIQIL